ncbi:site-specific DNA-methyltransferase [Gemella massiliensis]|uniref:site-specific DNA-methyltransferase n=1 Tax=Gemella massiliensis TaxID=1909670 RepID=UPI00092FEAF0|nr:site-specific DNA-methyltransferase [Gemella massiliensis]
MANLSKIKREKMLEYLEKLKVQNNNDENIRAITEIENALNEKKYGLVWEEHSEKVDKMLEHNIPIFIEDETRKITANEDEPYNFLLEGDNLHSLKLLEKTHKGKIDVTYIDPPYNTGNKDFIYDDSFVDKTDGYAHSKWLSFMEKRLVIARELLSSDGVIFISIDDNEQAQLKLLCDSIFGEDNFIAVYKWNKTATAPSLSQKVRNKYEYIICYEKIRNSINYNGGTVDGGDVPLLNRGNNVRDIFFKKGSVKFMFDGELKPGIYDRVELKNDIKIIDGLADKDFTISGEFKWTQETLNKEVDLGTTFIVKSKKLSIRFIRKVIKSKRPSDIISKEECGVDTNETAKRELFELVPNNSMDYPKPKSLVSYLVKFNESGRKNNIILDFFAGSGTTGHAVMQLNKEDGGNRKYILCTNNENNICEEITYQRLKNIQEEFPHNLKYYKTDFIPKFSDDEESISDKMMEHIRELIELEYAIELDDKKYIILDDEDALDKAISKIENGGKLFVRSGIFLSRSNQRILEEKGVSIIEIPEYYFREELKEVGEL